MPLETELKYIGADLGALRDRLQTLDAKCQGRRFERNIVFDDEARTLKERGILVRLRDDGRQILTLKRPPKGTLPKGVKAWDELETTVGDLDVPRTVLETLGYTQSFVYEKVREEWQYGGCHICLDEMPFGDFVEIEGPPEAIALAARGLELDGLETSTANYHQLNREHRLRAGLPEQDDFAFAPGQAPAV